MANWNYFKTKNLRLELHINGSLFNSVEIDEDEILPNYYAFKFRVPLNEETIALHVSSIEKFYTLKMLKACKAQFYLIVESKASEIVIDD